MKKFIRQRLLVFSTARHQRARGFALIAVLLLLTLLGGLGAEVIYILHKNAATAKNTLYSAQAEELANAGIYINLHRLSALDTAIKVPVNGIVQNITVRGQTVQIMAQDETGKVDLNTAPSDFLKDFLIQVGGLPETDSESVVSYINELREKARQTPADDPLKSFKTKAFHTISQLKTADGMTNAVWEKISPMLTVYSFQASPTTLTAPDILFAFLVERQTGGANENLQEKRKQALTLDKLSATSQIPGLPMMQNKREILEGKTLSLYATAKVGETLFTRHVIVRLTNEPSSPYKILYWGRGYR